MTRMQTVWVVFFLLNLGLGVLLHGKERDPHDLRGDVVSLGLSAWIWWWAGLWEVCQ